MYFYYKEPSGDDHYWEYILDIDLSESPRNPTAFWFKHEKSNGWKDNKHNALNWDWFNRRHLPVLKTLTEEELFVEIL